MYLAVLQSCARCAVHAYWTFLHHGLTASCNFIIITSAIILINIVLFFDILLSNQFCKGGPIIAFQIENEYGNHYTDDVKYMEHLKSVGVTV